ncbi:ABC-2 type transport system permease protein [Ureibacillus xyleni]|uniref:ABC-2 type transport system permease protein n=1 Tax=Ureibacillus xyleni TaxID=614648 RepID=A0A285S029_9BACL|nr:ABC transporter permease [Ureibacillus xyleni]SOB99726.1 ABC-2 type transport system permease protein [Ureibacillus xyleni]
MNGRHFKGTTQVTKIIFRAQRIKICAWILGIVLVTLAVAYSYPNVYQDDVSKKGFAITMQNPAMVAMLGPGYDEADYFVTVGTQFAHEMLLFTIIAVAVMSILLVGSSTRTDEETGRIEVVRSLPVGRLSYLAASLIVVAIANFLITLFCSIGLYLLNIDGITLQSALLYGGILGVGGLFFGIITALFAQVSPTSRGTTGLSFGVLVVAYLVRAFGDVTSETIAFASPLGWLVRTDVFINNNWWPILLTTLFSVIISFFAFYLNSIRDIDAGFLPSMKGKTHASKFLMTVFGLAFRLQKVKMLSWGVGIFALSASFGAVLGDLETYFSEMEFLQLFFNEQSKVSMTDNFISLLMAIMSLIVAIPVTMTILKLKSEETHNRTENFFSRVISRNHVLSSYTLLAVLESIYLQFLLAIGLWVASSVSLQVAMKSSFIYLPALWLMISLSVMLYGAVPKIMNLIWIYVAFCFIVIYLSEMLNFPLWLRNVSAFESIPNLPAAGMSWSAIIVEFILTIAFSLIGFVSYNRRDLKG